MSENENVGENIIEDEVGIESDVTVEEEIEVKTEVETEYDLNNGVSYDEIKAEEPVKFNIRSLVVSINGINFSRGTYHIGQLVGTIEIDKEIMNTLLSIDSQSITTNSHIAS